MSMWTSFFVAFAFVVVLLYLPGGFQARALGFSRGFSLACAPVISISEYIILGIIFQVQGYAVSWVCIFLLPALLALVGLAYIFGRKKKSFSSEIGSSVYVSDLVLYVVFGIAIAFWVYVKCLDGAGSYAQIYDNAYHLNLIRSYSDNGVFSVLASSVGGVSTSGVLQPASFYPAAWHIVCALVDNALSVGAPVSENAVNSVFLGVVFPLSTCIFLSSVFPGRRRTIRLGAIVTLAFSAFPWGMLTFGPLYSNFASFSMLGSVLSCVILFLKTRGSKSHRVKLVIVFLFGFVSLAASQPNAIFTAVGILFPYVMILCYEFTLACSGKRVLAATGSILLAFAFFFIWTFLWSLPAMEDVVSYPWPSFASLWQSCVNVVVLSLRDSSAQLTLGILVAMGFLVAMRDSKIRWISLSYILLSLIYVICASCDGTVKTFFSGFWYNDPYRVAACVAFCGIPLAALGLNWVCDAIIRKTQPRNHRFVQGAILLMVVVGLFAPAYSIPGYLDVGTSFGQTRNKLDWLADPSNRKYTIEESAFVDKAKDIIGDDLSLVLNNPYDGSVFAYGENGMNVAYRSFGETSGVKDDPVCRNLSKISVDSEVRDEVEEMGARYVLLLDCNWLQGGGSVHEDLFEGHEADWDGFLSLRDDTPGFTLLLSEDDMRLYAIDEE